MPRDKRSNLPIEDCISMVEEILARWQNELRSDYLGYQNHVYRVVHFCFALRECNAEEREKIIIAGCFHDLGIWANGTFDYLSPSVALAQEYLSQNHLEQWIPEIALMIDKHHQIRKYDDARFPLVEVFRKADWVDVSLGLVRCGLPKAFIQSVKARFPNAGFHTRLAQLAGGWAFRHPFNPLPVLK